VGVALFNAESQTYTHGDANRVFSADALRRRREGKTISRLSAVKYVSSEEWIKPADS
jgi:hypothetical protein